LRPEIGYERPWLVQFCVRNSKSIGKRKEKEKKKEASRPDVNPSVSKANAGISGRQQHLRVGVLVILVPHRAGQVVNTHLEGSHRPDVTNRVAALVRRPEDGVSGPRGPLIVWNSGIGLKGVTTAKELETDGEHK